MRNTISSAQTFFMKIIFPTIWIGGFTIATLMLFSDITDESINPPPPDMKWTFLLATLAGCAFIYWFCIRLKRVEVDDKFIYISNYHKLVLVPLQEIEEVTENRWINIHPVTIRFCRDTDFGNKIVFMPKIRFFAFFSSHPIVAELRAAASHARNGFLYPPAA